MKSLSNTSDPVAKLSDFEWEEKARQVALRKLDRRAHTRFELAEAMSAKGVPEPIAESVLNRFEEVGLVDDFAFAQAWVENRLRTRKLAARALKIELIRKGVPEQTATQAIADLNSETEYQVALDFARGHLMKLQGKERSVIYRRLVGSLARRGYSAALAYQVAIEVLNEQSDF